VSSFQIVAAAIAALFTEDADLERGPSTSRDTVPER